jgi:dTDP-4-dehydrorhamnose reductase
VIAEEAANIGAGLIHFSTDYVYEGNKPSVYFESDAVNPLSVYGKTKLAGERAIQAVGIPHLILRTSWVYGPHGKNFLKTILRLSAERDQLNIVADQWGAPTSSDAIAEGVRNLLKVWQMQDQTKSGVYHFTNTGSTSWFGFAKAILLSYESKAHALGLPALKIKSETVMPISTAHYPTPAARPANSRLDNTKLQNAFGFALPDWETSLQEVMQQIRSFD